MPSQIYEQESKETKKSQLSLRMFFILSNHRYHPSHLIQQQTAPQQMILQIIINKNSLWRGCLPQVPRVRVSCPETPQHVACWDWESNWSPLGLKMTALPTELSCCPLTQEGNTTWTFLFKLVHVSVFSGDNGPAGSFDLFDDSIHTKQPSCQ